VVDGCIKGRGGRGEIQEAWRALPPPLQHRAMKIAADLGIAEYFTAMVDPSNLASRRPLTEA
jgi:hypothetical protein